MTQTNKGLGSINDNQAVRALVGRSAVVIVKDGKFRGERGRVISGKGPGAGKAAAEVCVRIASRPISLTLPLTAVRETLVSRLVHQLGHLLPVPRR